MSARSLKEQAGMWDEHQAAEFVSKDAEAR
jgi:hypothetical protein